ncbi:hypothetical protein E3T46_17365 [Cryobacterium sp. Hh11]|uniref:hypothetical protein n=1 Tax=Cryobacterium sp. Hh11 TaxID=2555868 RepID=UPI00106B2932|nr:hypothetical protein [Cryobacterium sp. Hh11]TFD47565.1 hypothetical protein E3T46_17365 [Cryobacterium sp. Hh11]
MAITGYGFDGTLDEAKLAKMMALAGVRYAVGSAADYMATQVAGVRSISISAGDAYAPFVMATAPTAEVVAFSAPTAGQWHLSVLRRTWAGTGGTCELVAVAGATTTSTTPTAPPTAYPTINSTPGVVDDQPLWWAWVNATTTAVALFDARATSNDGGAGITTQYHSEFTTSISAASGSQLTLGTVTQTFSTYAGMVQAGTGSFFIPQAGIYAITVAVNIGAVSTGESFVGITAPNGAIVRGNTNSRDRMSVSVPNIRIPAGGATIGTELLQVTGATRTVTGMVSISRVG